MHTLILGITESGKSTLGSLMAHKLVAMKKPVVVYDRMLDPMWPEKAVRFRNPEQLSEYLENNRQCYVFIDEAGIVFDSGDYEWFTTTSRHWGHQTFLLSQRAVQIPRTVRDQCKRLYLFTSSLEDGKIHAAEWNKPILITCPTLPQLSFFMVDKFQLCERKRIKDRKDIVDDVQRNPSVSGDSANSRRRGNVDSKPETDEETESCSETKQS